MQETHALKEWQVAIEALAQGEMTLLLRKGGIRETGGSFSVQHDRVLLFPTCEHQKPHLLRPPYDRKVTLVAPGWHPEQVVISAWADITDVFEVNQTDRLLPLMAFHIWNQEFLTERLKWKPAQPLLVMVLRVYRLPHPVSFAYDSSYGGCRSWVDLQQPIALEGSTPALADPVYLEQLEQIRQVVSCGKVL